MKHYGISMWLPSVVITLSLLLTAGFPSPAEGQTSGQSDGRKAGLPPGTLSVETPGLVGHWAIEESGGTAIVDSSASGNNGTAYGSPSRVAGMSGQGLRLNGSNQYVKVPDAPSLDVTSAITLAVWVRPEALKTQTLINKATFSTVDGYELSLSSGGKAYVRFNQVSMLETRRVNSVSSYPYDGSTWMHVAATYDGSVIKLYINGVLEASKMTSFTINANAVNLGLGAQVAGTMGCYAGTLDEARVYDRALSDEEILALAGHTITAEAGPNGSITPSGAVLVGHGSSKTFSITPDPGYQVDSVLVDGNFEGTVSEYTFNTVVGDHTIRAVFELIPVITHTITATAGPNGSIAPEGDVSVIEGGDQAFVVTPDAGYSVDSLLVDDLLQDSITGYTFYDVTTDHTIRVTFELNTVDVTVTTEPAGLSVVVDGASYTAPHLFTWATGSIHTIGTAEIQGGAGGVRHAWQNWSDGGSREHAVGPSTDSAFTASFATQYLLTMSAGEGGTADPAGGWFAQGAVVGISATPATGHRFLAWTGTGAGSYTGPANPADITMNGPITEEASFDLIPLTISILTDPPGLGFVVDDVGYTSPQEFTWDYGTPHVIGTAEIQAGSPGTRYLLSGWSDGGSASHSVSPTSDSLFTAVFATQHLLTMGSGPHGGVGPAGGWYNAGTALSISATADPDYHFVSWAGSGEGSYSGTDNPAMVTMLGPISETGSFAIDQVEITVGTDPPGREFTLDGEAFTTTQVRMVDVGSSHSIGTTTPQPGAAGIRYVWGAWSDGGGLTHEIVSSTSGSYIASFTMQHYLTMIGTGGGSVTPPDGWYEAGAAVEIAATASPGWIFSGWNGSGAGSYTGPNNPANVTMAGPVTETASFTTKPVTVDIVTTPAGLNVEVDGIIYSTPRTFDWEYGSTHSIAAPSPQQGGPGVRYEWDSWSDGGAQTHSVAPVGDMTVTAAYTTHYALVIAADAGGQVAANPVSADGWYAGGTPVQIMATADAGYRFTSWRGAGGSAYSGTDNPAVITMNSPVNDTAGFARLTYTLTVHAANGTVTRVPDLAEYDSGTVVHLTPVPAAGYRFKQWGGDFPPGHTNDNPLNLAMDGNKQITALFELKQYTLGVAATHGSVVRVPDLPLYDHGTSVQLTAIPEDGYHFSAWSGDIEGSLNPETIVMTADMSVTAGFGRNDYTISASAGPHGDISPAGEVMISHGASQRFTFLPEPGYHLDSTIVDGLMVPDSVDGYTFVNVTSDHTIRVTFAQTMETARVAVVSGWNLLSLPLLVPDPRIDLLFPGGITQPYCYVPGTGYEPEDSAEFGCAFWGKYTSAAEIPVDGVAQTVATIDVHPGWNMIGAPSGSVAVGSITSEPAGLSTSRFFGYSGGYHVTNTLRPGQGYWVRVDREGTLTLSAAPGGGQRAGAIRVNMLPGEPPPPPADVAAVRVPEQYLLEPAYPNPFNAETIIRYDLPVRSSVAMTVFNALGQEVTTLSGGIEESGSRTVRWTAAGFPSGVYYCRFIATPVNDAGSTFVKIMRLLLVK